MTSLRMIGLLVAGAAVLAVGLSPAAAQPAKGKNKPTGLQPDPTELPKAGTPLGPMALVQRPGFLKGARTWTIESRRHRWAILCMAASPDGRTVATGGYDGLIRLWQADSGELTKVLVGHEAGVYHLAWSPDGHYLASAGSYSTRIWDPKTGLVLRNLKADKIGATFVTWFPDGSKVVTGGGGSGYVALLEVSSGKQLAGVEYGNAIQAVAVSQTGEHVAVAIKGGTFILDPARLRTVHTVADAAATNYALAFTRDGKALAIGAEKTIRLIRTEDGAQTKMIASPGYSMAWTPKGSLLAATTSSAVIEYAPGTFEPGKPLPGLATSLSLSADGQTLFGLYSPEVTRWDLEKARAMQTIKVVESPTLTTGPSANIVFQAEGALAPVIWEPASGKQVGPLESYAAGPGFVWSANGKFLASAGYDKKVRIWDPATGKLTRTLTSPRAVLALAVAGDGKVAVSTEGGKVLIWPANGETPAHTLNGHSAGPTALAWSRDHRSLATANEKELMTWAAETGKQLKSIELPRPAYSVVWTSDGGRLVVGSSEETALVIYSAGTGKPLTYLEKGGISLAVSTLSWSPDGGTLLGFKGNALQQWIPRANRATLAIGSPGPPQLLNFTPDGRSIVSACADRAVRYFDASTGRLRYQALAEKDRLIAIHAEGHYRPADVAEADLIAIVSTDKGLETIPLKELSSRFGFRNQPNQIK